MFIDMPTAKLPTFTKWLYNESILFFHSTETALLEVLDGLYTAADNKQVTILTSLHLSAAFDTVDHEILLERLQTEFGVTGTPLAWLQSYLDGRTQCVKMGQHQSPVIRL